MQQAGFAEIVVPLSGDPHSPVIRRTPTRRRHLRPARPSTSPRQFIRAVVSKLPETVHVQVPRGRPYSAPQETGVECGKGAFITSLPPSLPSLHLRTPEPPPVRRPAASSAWAAMTVHKVEENLTLSPFTQSGVVSPVNSGLSGSLRRRRKKKAEPVARYRCPQCRQRLAAVRLCPIGGMRHNTVLLTEIQSGRIAGFFGNSWQSDQAPVVKRRQLLKAMPLLKMAVFQKGNRREQLAGSILVNAWEAKQNVDLLDEMIQSLVFPGKDVPPSGETEPDPVVLLARICTILRDLVCKDGRERREVELWDRRVLSFAMQCFLTMEGPDLDRLLLHRLAAPKYWDTPPVRALWAEYQQRNQKIRNRQWAKLTVLLTARCGPLSPPPLELFLRLSEGTQALRSAGLKKGVVLLWVTPCIFSRSDERCSRAEEPRVEKAAAGDPSSPTSRRPAPQERPTGALMVLRNLREGLDLSTLSQYPGEQEVLIPPLTFLRVVSVGPGVVEVECEGRSVCAGPALQRVAEKARKEAEGINKELEAAMIFQRAAMQERWHGNPSPLAAEMERQRVNAAYSYLGPPDTVWIRHESGQCEVRKGSACAGADIFSRFGADHRRQSQARRASRFRQQFRAEAAGHCGDDEDDEDEEEEDGDG
eukprot:Hpha_TRINITY_DN15108_c0_g2::TRINITY_DN15108_c0_g2_i2::g.127708::m.127708